LSSACALILFRNSGVVHAFGVGHAAAIAGERDQIGRAFLGAEVDAFAQGGFQALVIFLAVRWEKFTMDAFGNLTEVDAFRLNTPMTF
jgi:hypothetical protein